MVKSAAAQQPTRHESFKTFWLSHHLFVVFWGCLMLHGPVFWLWSGLPLLFYFVYRMRQGRQRVLLREVVLERPDVIRLSFSNRYVDRDGKFHERDPIPEGCRRELFEYTEGMYIKIMFPDMSAVEWHPFTISSAPQDPVLTVHIKVRPFEPGGRTAFRSHSNSSMLIHPAQRERLSLSRAAAPRSTAVPTATMLTAHSSTCAPAHL